MFTARPQISGKHAVPQYDAHFVNHNMWPERGAVGCHELNVEGGSTPVVLGTFRYTCIIRWERKFEQQKEALTKPSLRFTGDGDQACIQDSKEHDQPDAQIQPTVRVLILLAFCCRRWFAAVEPICGLYKGSL